MASTTRSVMLEAIPRIQPQELIYEGGEIERGSFGDVRKAKWRGQDVAVKLFIVADKKGGISEEVDAIIVESTLLLLIIQLAPTINATSIIILYLLPPFR